MPVRILTVTGTFDGAHHRIEDAPHERLVAEQRGAAQPVVDLLRRAAHVDVDDLRAQHPLGARRSRELRRIVPGQLHRARFRLALVVHPLAATWRCATAAGRR